MLRFTGKLRLRLSSCTLLGLALVGCGPLPVPSGLVYCSEGNPESFNPQTVTSGTTIDATSHQIYNRLIDDNPYTGEFIPALATSWHVSKDGLNYDFELRHGVNFQDRPYFHPTRQFNADDVVFSFERIIDKNNPFHFVSRTGYPFFESIGFEKLIKRVVKLDSDKVRFELNYPDASFMANMATDFAVILSKEYADQLQASGHMSDIDSKAVGTGPFMLVDYVKNEYIRFRRHPGYWGTIPSADQLVFDITPRSTIRLSKLIVGDCSISALPKAGELPVVAAHENLTLESQPGMNVAYWAFNTRKPPLDNIKVRQALAYAIDKQNLLRAVYQDTAVEASGILPPSSWAYTGTALDYQYNPQKARDLLKQAGIRNLSIDIWAMPVARIYNPNSQKTAELIQADLAAVGVRANIVSYDWSVFTRKLSSSNYDSVLIGWSADNSDPDNFYTPLLSCGSVASKSNRSNWCNAQYDKLINRAKVITDKGERTELYRQAEEVIDAEVPLVPLAYAKRMLLKHTDAPPILLMPFGGIGFNDMGNKGQQ
ncbi:MULTISPECIES: ABC transporter substrate-binding protein [Shewanella]|uniref:ABC transporter substrate-binding protein n=1 Tax=Shewanella TaxID=22 RepID=UPI0016795EEC|nr:ABC transporter substrate-binding protein [Shewanella fodinae]MCL2905045.1 ABC transporter substrate-binding protein [Shewanella fodinae]GGY89026.1 ABC transporter substrate-binding protein [Shewanella fodinae]